MLRKEIRDIIAESRGRGWVLEPEAKRVLAVSGIDVPNSTWAKSLEKAIRFTAKIGYPVAAKVVSPQVLHKSDVGGVVLGIDSDDKLSETFNRFSAFQGFAGMLVEEMVAGAELIIGAKVDYQFGPIIVLGIGGTGVEIYKDTTLRMAPLKQSDVASMLKGLKAHQLLEGYRGSKSVNLERLNTTMLAFSHLVMRLEDYFESIDLNPVMCSSERCVVADARIMLK